MSFNFTTCRNFFSNPSFDPLNRPWSRQESFQNVHNFTFEEINMRKKAEILKYKNNNINLSKKALYARKAKALGVEQKSWSTQSLNYNNTNPNIRNLEQYKNTLICPLKKYPICNNSANSNVPGKIALCYDNKVPLINYNEKLSYSKIGTTWPQF